MKDDIRHQFSKKKNPKLSDQQKKCLKNNFWKIC